MSIVMSHYQKPPELYDGLRLHQNENTGGCSPRVIEALARLRPDQIGFYPPYTAAIDACASVSRRADRSDRARQRPRRRHHGGRRRVPARRHRRAAAPEAIVPEPAFEIFRFDTAVAGGALVPVMPQPDFSFPLDEVLAAITPEHARRVPDEPEQSDRRRRCRSRRSATIARRCRRSAIVFVDEAYAEFAGVSFIPELPSFPNVIVGRTFSKAFGLAGLRIGCLVGAPDTLDPIRRAMPVYSVNIAAAVALPRGARRSRSPRTTTCGRSNESKALLYAACDRLGLDLLAERRELRARARRRSHRRRWSTARVARGIYLRDRSTEPGCAGCLRIATGIVEHTQRVHRRDGGGPVRRARDRSATRPKRRSR